MTRNKAERGISPDCCPEMSRCDTPFILTAASCESMIMHRFVEGHGDAGVISMRADRVILGVLGAGLLTATSHTRWSPRR